MAFDSLSEKLQNIFKKLRGKGRLSADDVKTAMKEVKMALLEADVNFKVVKQFTIKIIKHCLLKNFLHSVSLPQLTLAIIHKLQLPVKYFFFTENLF